MLNSSEVNKLFQCLKKLESQSDSEVEGGVASWDG